MSAELARGPTRWEPLLAETSPEVRAHVYVACADCRETHGGWCIEDLVEEEACPLLPVLQTINGTR